MAQSFVPMQGVEVRFEGQPVAIVLGEPLEAAEKGARRVEVAIRGAGRTSVQLDWAPIDAVAVTHARAASAGASHELAKGDVGRASAGAAPARGRPILQPSRHHNPMEPSASLAIWDGDTLILTTPRSGSLASGR